MSTNGDPIESDSRRGTLSRRTLAGGAAWAVPAVALAGAAPAMAASCGTLTWRVDPAAQDAKTSTTPATWTTTPLVLTIPPGQCPIVYTLRGGDGSFYGGGGVLATGTIERSDPTKELTLTIIAGAHGEYQNAANGDYNFGGPGFGKGGDGTWLSHALHSGGDTAWSTSGGGGGGSAILLGDATSPTQSSVTPLVVAGGGGGGGANYHSGAGAIDWSGTVPGGSAQAPGVSGNAPYKPSGSIRMGSAASPRAYYGMSQVGNVAAVNATGANGGAGATSSETVYTDTPDATISIINGSLAHRDGGDGGDYGTGLYGGGNGGVGNTTKIGSGAWCPGGMGGGGYAGGGGGLTMAVDATFVVTNPTTGGTTSNTGHISVATGGGAGSSYVASSSLSNPNGGSVTVNPSAWTPQPYTPYAPVHGYVEITFS